MGGSNAQLLFQLKQLVQMFLVCFQLGFEVLHDWRRTGLGLLFHAFDVFQIFCEHVDSMFKHNNAFNYALFQAISSALCVVVVLCEQINMSILVK